MGGRLVRQAFTALLLETERGRPFTSNERAVLVYMASVAHDDHPQPKYWGGRETLAEAALGKLLPKEGDDPKKRASILKSVSIATRGLVARGALSLVGAAHHGRRQEYFLTVDNLLPAAFARESDVPPSGMSGSTIPPLTFHHSESDVPPKTNRPTNPVGNPNQVGETSHLKPVDNPQEEEVAA